MNYNDAPPPPPPKKSYNDRLLYEQPEISNDDPELNFAIQRSLIEYEKQEKAKLVEAAIESARQQRIELDKAAKLEQQRKEKLHIERETAARTEQIAGIYSHIQIVAKVDKNVRDVANIIVPILDTWVKGERQIFEFDAPIYDQIFAVLKTLRMKPTERELFARIFTKHGTI